MTWVDTTVGEVMTLQRGFDITRANQQPGHVPVISSGGISSFHNVAMAQGPGVIIGRKGTLGTVFFSQRDYWPHDTTLWVKDFKGNSPRFVYYFLKQLDVRGLDVGSANPALNRNHVHPLPIRWPSTFAEQETIAAVLGSLDDKIVANRGVALTADSLATAYSAMSPSACMLADIADLDRRTVTPSSLGLDSVAHYSIPAFDNQQQPSMDTPSEIKSSKFLIDSPRVLISKLNPRFPRVWAVDNRTGLPGLASTELLPLAPIQVSYKVLKAILGNPDFGKQLEGQVAGTSGSHQRVRPEDLMRAEVSDPRALSSDVVELIDGLVGLAVQTRRENRTLIELRDTLLPAFMSGRLRVKDAEKKVEDAV